MAYFLAAVPANAGFLFGYDEGVIAVVQLWLDKDGPIGPLIAGFMTASVRSARSFAHRYRTDRR